MNDLEFWLKGPVEGVLDLLQPVAHALLQVQKELHQALAEFDNTKLWTKPKDAASVGFHLNHLSGVIDRLFTYAKGQQLSDTQLAFLKSEGVENNNVTARDLLVLFDSQLEKALNQLRNTDENALAEVRFVGRKMIPSTVIGLLFHAAEHSTRHFGQLLATVKLM
ncbi:MAG TPA: DinB family protein [Leadbetterella sp.]|nr:DinB family protein [Leadbetterella sp.]